MNLMTPEEARWAIDDAEYVRANLPAECWRALETVAGMRTEWSRQALISGDPEWHPIRWCRSREEAERTYWTRSLPSGATVEYRLVPRYIIEPEATDGRNYEH